MCFERRCLSALLGRVHNPEETRRSGLVGQKQSFQGSGAVGLQPARLCLEKLVVLPLALPTPSLSIPWPPPHQPTTIANPAGVC